MSRSAGHMFYRVPTLERGSIDESRVQNIWSGNATPPGRGSIRPSQRYSENREDACNSY